MNPKRRWRWYLGLISLLLLSCAQSRASISALAGLTNPAVPAAGSAAATPQELAAKVQARLTESKSELGRWLSTRENSPALPAGATPGEAVAYQAALTATVGAYQQHVEELTRLESARQSQLELDADVRSPAGTSEAPPYPVRRMDILRNSIQSLKAKIKAGQTAREILEQFRVEGEAALKQSEARLRRLNEELEEPKDKGLLPVLNWQRALEQARNNQAAAQAGLNNTRYLRLQEEMAGHQQRLTLLQRQLVGSENHVTFPAADLAAVTQELERESKELEAEKAAAEEDRAQSLRALAAGRAGLQQALLEHAAQGPAPATPGPAVESWQRQIELHGAQVETATQRLAACVQLLELLGNEKILWQARYLAYETTDLAKLQQAYKGAERLRTSLRLAAPHFQQQVELAGVISSEQRERLRQFALPGQAAAHGRQLLATFEVREEWARRALGGISRLELLTERWREELDRQRDAMSLGDRVRDLFSNVSGLAARFWSFELLTVQDTITVDGQSITGLRRVTVGKIGTALLILVVGYWGTILVGRLFEGFATRQLKIEPNQARLMRHWVRIFLVLALIVFSLVLVKIPLTVFAFMGGALAIGIGFGTQNLLKNFISGIIILFERRFRVGDVLDISDRRGTITSIGIRASVLQLWDGTEVVIPNSSLLENNVINWTYSNRTVRFAVSVGVAYGSDTRLVAKLLLAAAEEHGLVQKEPKPQVLLQEFGDSALIFEVRYWVDVLGINAAQVASDLRHMIAASLAARGIVIAFPQRDLRLEVTRPLPVQVVDQPENTAKG